MNWILGGKKRKNTIITPPRTEPAPPAAPSAMPNKTSLPHLGLNIHPEGGIRFDPSVLQWAARSGCRWVRTTGYVDILRVESNRQLWSTYIKALSQRWGFRVLVVFHSVPDDVDLPAFLIEALEDCPHINAVQIGNELNVDNPWAPKFPGMPQYDRGQAYAALLENCAVAVRSRASDVDVLTAGIVGNPTEFLTGMADHNSVPPDGIALHVYGLPVAGQLPQAVRAARSVFPNAKMWVTEVGSEGGRTDESQQNADMVSVLGELSTLEFSDVEAQWYCAAGDWSNSLLRQDGSERPAAITYSAHPKAP